MKEEKKQSKALSARQLRKEKLKSLKLKGYPIISLLLISLILLVISLAFCFLALFVTGFVSVFIENQVAILIIMGIASLVALFFVNYFLTCYLYVQEGLLENIYKQGRTIWFIIYEIALLGTNLLIILGAVSNILGLNLFAGNIVETLKSAIAELESSIGFGFIDLFVYSDYKLYLADGFSGADYFLLFTSLAFIAIFVFFIIDFHREACGRCGRAYIMRTARVSRGTSVTRAEFETTKGHWTDSTAKITNGQYQTSTVSFDQYVPGSTEFKGVYTYTPESSTERCPICGKEKVFHFTNKKRIL